jgi:Fe-S-cluster containining protein
MPDGKPAGVRCLHLTAENLCSIYFDPERPKVCKSYQATEEFCGRSAGEAIDRIGGLEAKTIGPMGP